MSTIYESMAISMAPTGTKPSMTERKGQSVDMGGGISGRELKMSAEVVSVDPAANTVTFKGPKGNMRTIYVADPANQEKLPSLKPGQVVQFDYTEAVAASIHRVGQVARRSSKEAICRIDGASEPSRRPGPRRRSLSHPPESGHGPEPSTSRARASRPQ